MADFSKKFRVNDPSQLETAVPDTFDGLGQDLERWSEDENNLSLEEEASFEEAVSEMAAEITHALENWLDEDGEAGSSKMAKKPIYRAMITFFSEDDWPFSKLQGSDTLRLAFQGENGQWNCYAIARDEQAQFIFYSMCSLVVTEEKRPAIAEFTARANFGLVPASFEFDFESGEIRLKSSLDVTHLDISSSAIEQIVYTNVTLMDRYLPGIISVLEQDANPKDAIQSIEGRTSTEEDADTPVD